MGVLNHSRQLAACNSYTCVADMCNATDTTNCCTCVADMRNTTDTTNSCTCVADMRNATNMTNCCAGMTDMGPQILAVNLVDSCRLLLFSWNFSEHMANSHTSVADMRNATNMANCCASVADVCNATNMANCCAGMTDVCNATNMTYCCTGMTDMGPQILVVNLIDICGLLLFSWNFSEHMANSHTSVADMRNATNMANCCASVAHVRPQFLTSFAAVGTVSLFGVD